MTDVQTNEDLVTVTIDGREIAARKDELVIDAAERTGTYIPRFCYHPRMSSVGMCRMCLVEVDTGRGPALQPSCMINCSDGMTVETESDVSKKAQEGVLEFLLVNHPLDCPVCDKGGECPLQDQTMAYGPGESRFLEEKRHYEKPIPISDLVLLDRERCILCDRCTRFADEVAGDPLISFHGRGNETQVNTFPDHPFSSYFSGNTVQICPVGALTATPYRFKARPWDLEETESTCTTCSVGCRVAVQSSRNRVLRYLGVDIDEVNWGWMCDKGRFAFEAVNSEDRLGTPLVRDEGLLLEKATWSHALGRAAEALQSGLETGGAEGVAVLGGARLTNEDAYAWVKFAKGVVGTDNIDCQLGDGLPPELLLGVPRATIDQACQPGGVVVLVGSDPKEELPVFYLRLRDAVVRHGVTLLELSPTETATSPLATHSLRYRPGELAQLMEALLVGRAETTEVAGVRADVIEALAPLLAASNNDGAGSAGNGGGGADKAAAPLTVVVGRMNLAERADSIAVAAKALAEAHPQARFLSGLRRGNVHGALDMGMAPGLLPGGVPHDEMLAEGREARERFAARWTRVPSRRGLDAEGILRAAAAGRIDTLFLVGADPLSDFPDRDLAERALAGARTVIASDLFLTESVRQADVVLPASGFAETDGTTTNMEGRISAVAQRVTPPGTAQADWVHAAELSRRIGYDLELESIDGIWDELGELAPFYAAAAPSPTAVPVDGVLLPMPAVNGAAEAGNSSDESDDPEESEGAEEAADDADAEASDDVLEGKGPDATGVSAEGAADVKVVVPDSAAAGGKAGEEFGAGTTASVPHRALLPLPPWSSPAPEPSEAYALRLVATRKLYDQGTAVRNSPALVALGEGAVLKLHPYDFDRLGIPEGEEMRVNSAAGQLILPTRPAPSVARGTAVIHANQGGGRVNTLLDVNAVVVDVRIERP